MKRNNPTVVRVSLQWLESSEWALSHGSGVVELALPAHHPSAGDSGSGTRMGTGTGWLCPAREQTAPLPVHRAQPAGRSEHDTDRLASLATPTVSFPNGVVFTIS